MSLHGTIQRERGTGQKMKDTPNKYIKQENKIDYLAGDIGAAGKRLFIGIRAEKMKSSFNTLAPLDRRRLLQ
jgi:hypothetical protein